MARLQGFEVNGQSVSWCVKFSLSNDLKALNMDTHKFLLMYQNENRKAALIEIEKEIVRGRDDPRVIFLSSRNSSWSFPSRRVTSLVDW